MRRAAYKMLRVPMPCHRLRVAAACAQWSSSSSDLFSSGNDRFDIGVGAGGILDAYNRLVRYGGIQPDGSQLASVQALQLLQGVLAAEVAAEAAAAAAGGSSGSARTRPPSAVQGAYMWGPPGRGKKMIMQLFARTLPPAVRVRHHTFPWLMHHVAERCRELEAAPNANDLSSDSDDEAARVRLGGDSAEEDDGPLEAVAERLAESCHLLCIEKVVVERPQDAATFSSLLRGLLERGCWVAFMSNRPLNELLRSASPGVRQAEGALLELCDTHLLQLNVSGGPSYHRTLGGMHHHHHHHHYQQQQQQQQQQQNKKKQVQEPEQQDSVATGADAAAEEAAGRCYRGPGGDERLREAWRGLVEASGGRECATSVAFAFFARDRLWLPKALVVGGGDDDAAAAAPPQQQQQHTPLQHAEQEQQQQHSCQAGCMSSTAGPLALGGPQGRQAQAEGQAPAEPSGLAAAYFEFESLCGPHGPRPPGSDAQAPGSPPPLSPMDCLALAEAVRGPVFIEGVPRFSPSRRGAAMRLVSLIDVLFDHGTPLHISAEAAPNELFRPLLDAALARSTHPSFWEAATAPPPQAPGAGPAAPTPSSEGALLAEEVLMLQRAAARLAQMTAAH